MHNSEIAPAIESLPSAANYIHFKSNSSLQNDKLILKKN